MDGETFLPVLLPLLSWPLAWLIGSSPWPRTASWLLVITGSVLAVGSTVALALVAAAGLSVVPGVATAGGWSAQALRGMEFVGSPVAVGAGVLLVVAGVRMTVVSVRHRRRARAARAAIAGARTELVVVDGGDQVAFAVPAGGGRIVVSQELLTALEPAQVRALLAHERAHLHGRHHLFLATARLAEALNPLTGPVRRALEYTLERWADEAAAAHVGDRRVVAAAVALAALRTGGRGAYGQAVTGGPVPRRVGALLSPPARSHRLLGVAGATALAVAAWSGQAAVEAAVDLRAGIEAASLGAAN